MKIKRKKETVAIFVRGGVVQKILSTSTKIKTDIIDIDDLLATNSLINFSKYTKGFYKVY